MLSAIKYQETSKFYEINIDKVIEDTVALVNQYINPVIQTAIKGTQIATFTPEMIRNKTHRDRLFVSILL